MFILRYEKNSPLIFGVGNSTKTVRNGYKITKKEPIPLIFAKIILKNNSKYRSLV